MSDWVDEFMPAVEPVPWAGGNGIPSGVTPSHVFVQAADYGLEVAAATSSKRPTTADMRAVWKGRHAGRPSPVLVIVGYPSPDGTRLAVCGPAGEDPIVLFDLEVARVERLAAAALAEPTRHAARRTLLRLLPDVETDMPGVVNSGLLANQELRNGVPNRADWASAVEQGKRVLSLRGQKLVEALGYTVEQLSTTTSVLAIEDAAARVDEIIKLVDELGLEPPPPPVPLPRITADDVHLICWLALVADPESEPVTTEGAS